MDVTFRGGYAGCKGTFSESVETAVVGIARKYLFRAASDKATNGNRYVLTRISNAYTWTDKTNNARVGVSIDIERERDNGKDGKYLVSVDFELYTGLGCRFLVTFDVNEDNTLGEWDIFHKGANAPNSIVQGIYGRLVDHTDALDYKDLDYV